jgi:Leucine-rich repeat (LRR) protein
MFFSSIKYAKIDIKKRFIMRITFDCTSNAAIAKSRFYLTKSAQTLTLSAVSKLEWETCNKSTNTLSNQRIFSLGALVEVLNSNSHTLELNQDGAAIKDRLMQACKKHNDNPLQYLKYLIIPWIVAQIFGWTCMTTYALPTFKINTQEQNSSPIQEANYTNKQLTTLSEEILNMKQLKKLNLEGNQLTDLPMQLAELTDLEELILDHNPFKQIPEVVFQLKKLKKLTFHGVDTLKLETETAKKFNQLPLLQKLDFGFCELIPEMIQNILKNKGRVHPLEQALKDNLPKECELIISNS